MEWFRWHHGTAFDPKWRAVKKLADSTLRDASVNITDVVAVWAAMLERASQSQDRGSLIGLNIDDFAAGMDMEPAQVKAIYDAMQGKTLDGNRLINWEKRQPEKEDSTATERKRRQRERDMSGVSGADVTRRHAMSRSVTRGHAASRNVTIEQNREDQSKEESPSPAARTADALLLREAEMVAEFEGWWAVYPVKKAPDAAMRAYRKARKNASAKVLLDAVRAFAAQSVGKDKTFLKHGATWLNSGCWLDEGIAPAPAASTAPCAIDLHDSLKPWADKLRQHFEPEALASYFKDVKAFERDDWVTLVMPTRFMASRIREKYGTPLRLVFGDQLQVSDHQPRGNA